MKRYIIKWSAESRLLIEIYYLICTKESYPYFDSGLDYSANQLKAALDPFAIAQSELRKGSG
jgi:hypothetical protein